MELDVSDWIQRNMYLGCYEQRETSRILSHLRPGMTFVDVGANVGYYTAMASSIVGAGRVISYEPNPCAYQWLKDWARANEATNITPVCAALGGEEGTIAAYYADADTGTTSLVPALACRAGNETVVNVRTLDSEAERLGIRHIDIMKIDVEGYEPQVFKGAARLLEEGRIGAILCEFVAEWLSAAGSSIGELERILASKGFVSRETYGTESAGDRWLVRSPRELGTPQAKRARA
jgi:FkbM family methyltransferase